MGRPASENSVAAAFIQCARLGFRRARAVFVLCSLASCGNGQGTASNSGASGGVAGALASSGGGRSSGGSQWGSSGGVGAKANGGAAGAANSSGGALHAGGASSNTAGGLAGGGASGGANVGGGGSSASGGTAATGGIHGTKDDPEPGGPLPVLWLTTPGADDPDAIGDEDEPGALRVIEAHDGTLSNPNSFATSAASLETPVSIHVHGRSSSTFAKKSYALEFRDANGVQVKHPFLGLPKESDWILHGPYPDKTYLRNALVYWLGRETYRLPNGSTEPGRWNPRTRFVEIYINARYWGVYVVVEKIKADADRVDVDRPAPDAQSGDVSGGYIIRREGGGDPTEGKDWVSGVNQLVYTHHYPKVSELSGAQRDFIRDYFDDFETMMNGSDWKDATRGYPAWVDVTTLLDYFLAMEWTNNIDGYFKSVYFVKHAQSQGGKLSWGPLWDFDIALGNADYRDGNDPKNWVYLTEGTEASSYSPPGEVPFIPPYVTRLWGDSEFRTSLRCRWETLRKGPFGFTPIEAQIDAWVTRLADAEKRDHARWPVIGQKLWPNPVALPSYAAEIDYLKTFLHQRFEFLDAQLAKMGAGTCR